MSSEKSPVRKTDKSDEAAQNTSPSESILNLCEISDPGSKTQGLQNKGSFPGLTSNSSSNTLSYEEIISAAKDMENMALAHEIAFERTFELEKQELPKNSLHCKVKNIVHQIFWDNLRKQIQEDPPNYTQALALLVEIKESLLSLLLPHSTRLKKEIEEVLDMGLIQQQVVNGTLEFPCYANYVIALMAKMCSPAREKDVTKLKEESDIVAVFRGILEVLELMKLDMANFTIKMYQPLLIANSVDYEKKMFKEFLKVKTDGLVATKAWLLGQVTSETPLASVDDRREVLAQAYLKLLTRDGNITYPETLLLDQKRFMELCSDVLRVSIAATIQLLVVSTVPQLQVISEFKTSLKDHLLLILQDIHSNNDLDSVLPNVSAQVIKDCNTALLQALTVEHEKTIDSQILQVSSVDHKIRQLVFSRIREFLHDIITSVVPTQQIPAGLTSFTNEISTLGAKFRRLVSYNRSVFGEYYMEILEAHPEQRVFLDNIV